MKLMLNQNINYETIEVLIGNISLILAIQNNQLVIIFYLLRKKTKINFRISYDEIIA